jgi:hypothetical protein
MNDDNIKTSTNPIKIIIWSVYKEMYLSGGTFLDSEVAEQIYIKLKDAGYLNVNYDKKIT